MRKILLPITLLLLASCVKKLQVESIESKQDNSPRIEEISVKFTSQFHDRIKDNINQGLLVTKSLELNEFFDYHAVKSIIPIFIPCEEYAERHKREGLDRWYTIAYDASQIPATKASEELLALEGVEIAERNHKIKSFATDPHFDKQWALYQPSAVDINVLPVWDNYTSGNHNVKVAVIDSGVDPNHEDLKDALDLKLSKNFLEDGSITGCEHGTHVAGIIAATTNNGIGISGIAGGNASKGIKPVTIMSCQVGDGEYIYNAAAAISWAADHGANIAQNSWGYVIDSNGDGVLDKEEKDRARTMDINSADKAAIDYFVKYAGCDNDGNQLPGSPMQGGVVIFAAGNENFEKGMPAYYDKVIAVGSIDNNGYKSDFSNYGDWVDICAPGSSIISTTPNSTYSYLSGTSMACPQVSGVAALVLSYRGGNGFTNQMLTDCLLKSASSKITARKIGPLVDALGAVTYGIVGQPDNLEEVSLSVNSNAATFSCKVPGGGDNKAAYAVKVYMSKDYNDLVDIDLKNPKATIITASTVTFGSQIGESVEIIASNLAFEQEYYYIAVAMNYGLFFSQPTAISSFTTGPNTPPVIEVLEDISNIQIKATGSKTIQFIIYDPDGHSFTHSFVPGSAADILLRNPTNGYWELTIDAIKAEAGNYTAEIIVTDSYKMSSKLKIPYTILENQAPTVINPIPNILLYEKDNVIEKSIVNCFADPDEDLLNYSVENNNPSVAHLLVTNGVLHITPIKAGTCDVVIKASDPKGLSVNQIMKVVVRQKGETVSVTPTQVVDNLYIGTGAELSKSRLRIISVSGGFIIDKVIEASAFEPAVIDMKAVAPGQYIVDIEDKGVVISKSIVKL